jgi:uncharacterized protein (TIGR03437 family)
VVSATQVNGQGGYAVTVQVTDSSTPTPGSATAAVNFGVNSDTGLGGCQMFPADSIYNQRIDPLPVDTNSAHQIPGSYLASPITPDFGHGFYPNPGGIPWMRVPANQPSTNVNLAGSAQIDGAGTYQWPFPAWPNAAVQGTSYGQAGGDHHILILQTSANGPCTLYETYQSNAVPSMFAAGSNTWFLSAGSHYVLNSDEIAASASTLDNGGQDSTGIPLAPLLVRYSEVPLGVQHPLRMTFPAPTNGFVWPATGCCGGSGPPEGLLYRLKASVNWQATCPASSNPQAATVLQALQQYGAYMSDHGSAGYIQGVPDVRWNDNDLACIKQFPVSDLEVVDNSMLEVSSTSGQTQPYVAPAALPGGTAGAPYMATIPVVGGDPATRQWTLTSGTLPPGLTLDPAAGTIGGTIGLAAAKQYSFGITVTDTDSGNASQPQTFSMAVTGGVPTPDLTIVKTHTGHYVPGQTDTYAITVSNIGTGPTTGTVTVTEMAPAGFTVASMAGTGWTCPAGGSTCTRADALAAGASYPVIVVTGNVSANAPASVFNTATVSGGGETNTSNDTSSVSSVPVQVTTSSVPVATQYQSYSTALTATGGTPPYTWSVVSSTGTSLPEGMSLNPVTGVVSATQVNGQGGYAVTVQVTDSGTPTPGSATATVNFGVNSDTGLGGCQMFPADSIYNQRIDLLPVDTNPSHQIPASNLASPIHPDFGHGFYPSPGGIPWMRVPANQPLTNVNLANSAQIDGAGTYQWPFPAWPNAVIEGTSYGQAGDDHHILILQSSANDINGPQTGSCTLYETYQSTAVPSMFAAKTNTWSLSAGAHYVLNSDEIAVASMLGSNGGAQDSAGIPMVPLLLRYSDVPLGAQHPLRITFPSPTNGFVWPGASCCGSSGPPEGLLYRLKASVNWQATCPASGNPQAATVLQTLQQYGAYMSDHGSAGYIQGAPDVRWDDNDLACIKQFHVSDLEVVDNSMLEVSSVSGQTQPYVAPAALPGGTAGAPYMAAIPVVGGNPATRQWTLTSGTLPPGLTLDPAAGTIGGTVGLSAGKQYSFGITVTDTASNNASQPQTFSIAVTGGVPTPDLTIVKTHTGQYQPGHADTYAITVSNIGTGPTGGTVTVTEMAPAGFTVASMAGTGWTCPAGGSTCARADALAAGASYPVIAVTGNVSANAPATMTNTATVSGGGETNTSNDTSTVSSVPLQITTGSVPVATQYQGYSTALTATGGTPPYTWSVVSSTGVGLPEGMSLNPATGVVSATQVNGQGGYAVTVQVTDSGTPTAGSATAAVNFGVNSDTGLAGCQMFPADSIYNQRIDLLPVDTNPSHQIPASNLASPIHPDFGHGFYPSPGGIPWMRVPANQPLSNVNLANPAQIDGAGTYQWPFPAWPNTVIEGTSYGQAAGDHHILILQSGTNDINGPQTGPCTLYETYQSTAAPSMFAAKTNTWSLLAGAHYVLNSDEIAVASLLGSNGGAQDSAGIPMAPLLLRYSDVPLGAQHPLRMTFPSPTNGFVWPGASCCGSSGPPEGLLYRLKANVNWQATCPASGNPQAATVLQALQQYGAYMSDHGSAGYIQGVPDVRWDDNDLACIKQFHVSDLEVVDNSMLEVSSTSGQTQPYVAPATLPGGTAGAPYMATIAVVGGNPATRQWTLTSGTLPPGLTLDPAAGTIGGTIALSAGKQYSFGITVTDTASGNASLPQTFSMAVGAAGSSPVVITAITNSASGAGGALAPGELVTIWGAMLGPATGLSFSTDPVATVLGGTRISFGAWAAPILYAGAAQINAVVPWEVAGQSQVTVVVQNAAAGSGSFNVAVAAAAPGVFTSNSTGTGQALALNQDFSPNGPANPAAAGSYVTVYFTGGGVTNPPGATGAVTGLTEYLTQNVTATVGNVPATVSFAGAAPGFVNGVNQLNIQLSASTPAGKAVPLTITVGGHASTATATLSVE